MGINFNCALAPKRIKQALVTLSFVCLGGDLCETYASKCGMVVHLNFIN